LKNLGFKGENLGKLKAVSTWMGKNPVKATILATIIVSPVINIYLKEKAAKEKLTSVYKKLEHGSNPLVPFNLIGPRGDPVIIQQQSVASITTEIFSEGRKTGDTHFSVVIGPSGCGKAYVIRDACCKYSRGILYCETIEPRRFVPKLAEEINMKHLPSTMFDLFLEYITNRYTHYHVLPDSQLLAMDLPSKKHLARYILSCKKNGSLSCKIL